MRHSGDEAPVLRSGQKGIVENNTAGNGRVETGHRTGHGNGDAEVAFFAGKATEALAFIADD